MTKLSVGAMLAAQFFRVWLGMLSGPAVFEDFIFDSCFSRPFFVHCYSVYIYLWLQPDFL